jgi:plasmid stability protein
MKNVTVTLDEDVALWARVWAARHDTSVSQLLGDMLRERMLREEGYEVAMAQYLDVRPRRLKQTGGYPTRDQVHERSRRT